jgi:tetratricopeptide (TPR) repeat protein
MVIVGAEGRGSRQRLKGYHLIALAISAAAALWLTLAVTLGGVFSARAPDLVLKLAPFDARAKAHSAYSLLGRDRKAPALARAEIEARQALAREPVNVDAVRTLGLVASIRRPEQQDRPLALFRYSEKLSRRDLATQLWLIEYHAQSGSIEGALKHFDTALRTSRSAPRILYPVLISASEDPAIAAPLAALLREKPFWWRSFVPELLAGSKSPVAIARLTDNLLDPRDNDERALIRQTLDRLIADGRHDLAWKIFENAARRSGTRIDRTQLVDGGFEGGGDFPPFGWVLVEEPDLSAARQTRPTGNTALYLAGRNGRGGEVARQLMLLPAGSYRLSATAGNVAGGASDRPMITVMCARGQSELLRIPFPNAPGEGRRFVGAFKIPATNCNAQWVRIQLRSTETTDGVWIDSLTLSRG